MGKESRPAKGGANAQLLPIYDEYRVSSRDRVVVPHGPTVVKSRSRKSVMFQHALVIAGQVAGTWRMTKAVDRTTIDVFPLRTLTKVERGQVKQAAQRYGRFTGIPVSASIAS